MPVLTFKKPVDLKNVRKKFEEIYENRKIIIPIILSVSGILIGSMVERGESGLFQQIIEKYKSLYNVENDNLKLFFNALIAPTVFFFAEFLSGLSISGVFILNFIPMLFGFLVGQISNYFYTTYSLKGLAYCVMMIFPYSAIILLSLVFNSRTNYNMSSTLTTFVTRKSIGSDFLIKTYCIELLKNYFILIFGVLIKLLCNYLFSSFFNF